MGRDSVREDASRKMQVADQKRLLAGVRVLLVEDEVDVAHLLIFMLSEAGAQIAWVMQSVEALAQLNQSHPDVLICNIKLPDHNGDWLIQKIRQAELGTKYRLPALAVSSYTREFAEEKMLKAGFDSFLPKNFDEEELISTILELV